MTLAQGPGGSERAQPLIVLEGKHLGDARRVGVIFPGAEAHLEDPGHTGQSS